MASNSAALSRTERVRAWATTSPLIMSPTSGPNGVRARVGLSPNTPQQEAGIRMEPPPSPPCAIGTSPAATAAAEPPLEPPVDILMSQGFLAGPNSSDSVVGRMPSSAVLVLPRIINPAFLRRLTSSLSCSGTYVRKRCEPEVIGALAYEAPRSFSRKGTPLNGPLGISCTDAKRA